MLFRIKRLILNCEIENLQDECEKAHYLSLALFFGQTKAPEVAAFILMRGNQLPVSVSGWQHSSQISFATFIL
jgi:hypothetical protein